MIVKDDGGMAEGRDHEVRVKEKKCGDYLRGRRKGDLKKKNKSFGKSYPQY